MQAARSELGYREKSGQFTKFGEWYAERVQDPQYRNAPWCDMFISWAADKAGVQDQVGQSAWTPSHAVWFIKQQAWSSKPEPGALVFYDWGGGKSYKGVDHVGIVEKVVGNKIHTIEANVDKVWLKRKIRETDKVVGYGLPRLVTANSGPLDVRPSEAPLTVEAKLPTFTVVREESSFDVIGTPQAVLAVLVLATIFVSFRVAGRSRGSRSSGRHRRWSLRGEPAHPVSYEAVAEPVRLKVGEGPVRVVLRRAAPSGTTPSGPSSPSGAPASGATASGTAASGAVSSGAVRARSAGTRRRPYEPRPPVNHQVRDRVP